MWTIDSTQKLTVSMDKKMPDKLIQPSSAGNTLPLKLESYGGRGREMWTLLLLILNIKYIVRGPETTF